MSYCLNPDCLAVNVETHRFCQKCGQKLWLKDRYQALKMIGQGGFGKTFLAVDHDKPSKPRCVIKQFFPQGQGTAGLQKAAELFAEEAKRLDELGKHPQIPELLAYFIPEDQRQYLVQEYIEGENLEQELKSQGVFSQEKVRQVLLDLLPVLGFVHQQNVIHRDIKPENIIRRKRDNQLVLVDFGAAKTVIPSNRSVTGTVIGSAEYVAPEQLNGKAINASDLYSLGVTCLYLLTGISPFDLFDVGEHEWCWRDYLVSNPVDSAFGQVLDKLVKFGTKKRYQDVGEVLSDLGGSSNPPLVTKVQSLTSVITVPTISNSLPPSSKNTTIQQKNLINSSPSLQQLEELDLALLANVSNYFESMSENIIRHYKDHHASLEEAKIIANKYREISTHIKSIKTQQEIDNMICIVDALKNKISRYRHDSSKYRWDSSLEKSALNKLKMIQAQPSPRFIIIHSVTLKNKNVLDSLDIATIRGLTSYFETMANKICQYHNDHKASREEAGVIAKYYLFVANQLKIVDTSEGLADIIQTIEILKTIVSRYQHDSSKYRWDVNLEKNALEKLRAVYANPSPVLPALPFLITESTLKEKLTIPKSLYKGGAKEIDLEMVILPSGEFLMGSQDNELDSSDSEKPQHFVKINSFAISKYLITQEQYKVIMGKNPSNFTNSPHNPVDNVSWLTAQEFCYKLNQITGKNYRLLTEAEWEYASRTAVQFKYSFGNSSDELKNCAWYASNSQNMTHPVGQKKANQWGIYDLYGNVWEWCADEWHDNYSQKPNNLQQNGNIAWANHNITNQYMVLRGGSYWSDSKNCRSASRRRERADFPYIDFGFRVALSLE